MAANPNEGNSPEPTGGTQPPVAPPSGSESQPLPDYVKALQFQLADLTTKYNGLQKGTDKQIGQVRGDIKRILELKDQGLNETQIKRELWLDQQLEKQDAPVPQVSGTNSQNTGFDIEPVLKSLQFPDNDPGLAALKAKHASNPMEFLKAATELRLSQAVSANPTPATSLSMQNTQQGQDEKSRIEAETQNYIQEMQGAQGKGGRFGDAIKDKYRQKGVEVDNINFKFS